MTSKTSPKERYHLPYESYDTLPDGQSEDRDKISKSEWEDNWKNCPRNNYNPLERYTAMNQSLEHLFKEHLPKEKGLRFIELGCARGNWLIYFHRVFGYEIHGLDYSEIGCEMARKNLIASGVKGKVVCKDALKFSPKEKFDIVFSEGLVEHFNDPKPIIDKHISLLNKGGYAIILIPNYSEEGYYRKMFCWQGRADEIEQGHNLKIMDKENFRKHFDKEEVELVFLDHYGPASIFSAFDPPKYKLPYISLTLLNQSLGYATMNMRSKKASVYIIAIAKKHD